MLRVVFFWGVHGCEPGRVSDGSRPALCQTLSIECRSLSFSDLCILLFMFLSLCRLCVCVFLCSHWSLVDVPLIFFCPADHVPDWQPRVLLGMVEARSVNVKKTTTTTGPDCAVMYDFNKYIHTHKQYAHTLLYSCFRLFFTYKLKVL